MSDSPVWSAAEEAAATASASGLKILDTTEGTGAELTSGKRATVHYTGWLLNGQKFDSSRDRNDPFTSRIPGQLIEGWNQGMLGMKVGGTRKLWIPSKLGYGTRGSGRSIPPNSDLVFEVELLDVK